ncbi:MAG: PLP-dependent aminotransferase family protein [Bacillota bacterium]
MIVRKNSDKPLYLQVYDFFKQEILAKRLTKDQKLPSVRQLTKTHNISKTTVESAFQQLLIEGYVKSIPKSGYYVLDIDTLPDKQSLETIVFHPSKRYPNSGQPKDSFDIKPLRIAYQNILLESNDSLYANPKPEGETKLRKTIREYLVGERGIEADPSQLIIASGLQNHLLTLSMLTRKRRIAFLTPLFDRAKILLEHLGFTLLPCHSLDEIITQSPELIYISPSNIYPSGDVLSIRDRITLIDYAKNNDAYIIEDDYNYIFRYNAYQIPSIQGLASGERVIYIGSLARNLVLSIRISYMILPLSLLKSYAKSDKLAQTVSTIDQLAVADYMTQPDFKKHLKKLSRYSKKQNEAMNQAIEQISEPSIDTSGLDSNLHILIKTTKAIANRLQNNAKKHGYTMKSFKDDQRLLLPYSGLSTSAIHVMIHTIFSDYLKEDSYVK